MKITPPQRTVIMKLWQGVCKDRGWSSGDRDFRLAKFSELIGRKIESSDDIGRIDECTKLLSELKAMLGVSIQAGLEANDQTINRARVLRHQIQNELIPCLALYLDDVRAYVVTIMEDKNRWWKIDRPVRDIGLDDLDAKPIFRTNRENGKLEQWPSMLEQLQYTLSARLNELRKRSGDTIHDMRKRAGLECNCARCRRPLVNPMEIRDTLEDEPVENPF
jgi:hypothetical protein